MKRKTAAYILLFLVAFTGVRAQAPDELSMRLFGYCAVASLTDATQNPGVCNAIKEICRIGDAIDAIDRDLSRSFLFVKSIRQVQLTHAGVYKGRNEAAKGPETFVYATEPLAVLHGGVLVFVSTSAPSRVALFSLEPDLQGELIYDSITKPQYFVNSTPKEATPIESIGSVQVDQRGSILLSEHSSGAMSNLARRFRVSYEHGRPELRLTR